jgi:hypothetical protein
MTLHQLYHLGLDNTLVLINKMFGGTKLKDTAQQVVQGCERCQNNNPNNKRVQVPGAQRQGSYPREDWQLDFTHMPGGWKSKLLLVFVDMFTGYVEAFPCSTEHARDVVQVLITEIIPHFGFPKSLQSHNGPAFKAEVTQGLTRALGIEYHLHCAWRPQSSCEVEKTNELLKRHLANLAQETYSPWTKFLPIALIRLKTIPGKQRL